MVSCSTAESFALSAGMGGTPATIGVMPLTLSPDDCDSYGVISRCRPAEGSPMPTEAFIFDAIRTPRGRGKQTGSLHETKPVSLVVGLIEEIRRRNPSLDPALIEDVVL